MNNDRGQSLHIPSSTPIKENNIYVATLHSVIQTDFSGEIKHQFTYEIEVNNQIVYANRNIPTKPSANQLSIHDWLKRHSNYSASHENYEPYIDQKHLILLGQYNGNYYVQDVASLDAFGGIIMNHILQMLSKLLSVAKEAIDRQGLIAILTIPVNNNDEIEETAQGETVYNELIDQLRLNIPKDTDYQPNIYSYFGIKKNPNDTVLMEMMIKVFISNALIQNCLFSKLTGGKR